MSLKKIVMLTVAAGLAFEAVPANAQQEEIIVTARKRQESILKVTVVESVISQESLSQFAIVSFTDISNHVPGLVLGNSTGIIGANVAIRGIGTSGTNPIVDQDVLLSIDGMPLTQGLAYTAGTFDLVGDPLDSDLTRQQLSQIAIAQPDRRHPALKLFWRL